MHHMVEGTSEWCEGEHKILTSGKSGIAEMYSRVSCTTLAGSCAWRLLLFEFRLDHLDDGRPAERNE